MTRITRSRILLLAALARWVKRAGMLGRDQHLCAGPPEALAG